MVKMSPKRLWFKSTKTGYYSEIPTVAKIVVEIDKKNVNSKLPCVH